MSKVIDTNNLQHYHDNIKDKLLPTGGSENQILAWNGDGTAKWEDIPCMFTGLEEVLAYGVEWKDNVADPHLTRIGNMSLHKTLPIQSQLKGCIAQKDKIMYWLDEKDWNFRKSDLNIIYSQDEIDLDPMMGNSNIMGSLIVPGNGIVYDNGNNITRYGIPIDNNLLLTSDKLADLISNSDNLLLRIKVGYLYSDNDTSEAKNKFLSYGYIRKDEFSSDPYITLDDSPIYDPDTNGLISNENVFRTLNTSETTDYDAWQDSFTSNAIQLLIIGIGEASRLDGYDGTVRVYCPNFYIKSQIIGNTRRVWLSTARIDNTWTHQPEILIDAYRSTVLNTVPENMGYLSTLPVNSAISVVNTATYCRGGGNRAANDKYLTGADDTTIDIFRTDLGKPRTSLGRPTMRTYSRNAGNEMLSYNQYKNIFYWLYVVEYANFNCQEAYNATLTEDGYHQGGMGPAVTTMNSNHQSWYNGYYPLTPCGYCNEFGNGTGIKDMVITAPSASDGSTTQTYTFQVPRWRGFDNPFGDIWTNLDGIVIERTTDLSNVWTTDDVSEYTDVIGNKTLAGKECLGEGYIKLFDLGETAEIIPSVNGGGASTTQYKCDYHWRDSSTSGLRTLLVGGRAYPGGTAGLGDFYSSNGVSYSFALVGFRSVSSFLSFSSF